MKENERMPVEMRIVKNGWVFIGVNSTIECNEVKGSLKNMVKVKFPVKRCMEHA
jgi:hypothetical protein